MPLPPLSLPGMRKRFWYAVKFLTRISTGIIVERQFDRPLGRRAIIVGKIVISTCVVSIVGKVVSEQVGEDVVDVKLRMEVSIFWIESGALDAHTSVQEASWFPGFVWYGWYQGQLHTRWKG